MKKLLLVAIFMTPLLIPAQKVKVKKNVVSIDKIEVGTVTKEKNEHNHRTFTYSNLQGEPVLIFDNVSTPSLLEGKDEAYYYPLLKIPQQNISVYYNTKGWNITTNTLVKYFVEKGIIDADGKINTSKAEELKSLPEIPEAVLANLEEEKVQMQNQDFILERDLEKPIIISLKKTKKLDLKHIRIPDLNSYIFDIYEIKQDDKILGEVIARYYFSLAETQNKGGNPSVFFLNSKGGRIAYINSFPILFRVHNGNTEYKKAEMKFLVEKSASKKIRLALEWVVNNNKL